jgi:hypothetical protein
MVRVQARVMARQHAPQVRVKVSVMVLWLGSRLGSWAGSTRLRRCVEGKQLKLQLSGTQLVTTAVHDTHALALGHRLVGLARVRVRVRVRVRGRVRLRRRVRVKVKGSGSGSGYLGHRLLGEAGTTCREPPGDLEGGPAFLA